MYVNNLKTCNRKRASESDVSQLEVIKGRSQSSFTAAKVFPLLAKLTKQPSHRDPPG